MHNPRLKIILRIIALGACGLAALAVAEWVWERIGL
jgi:hypothetical protein